MRFWKAPLAALAAAGLLAAGAAANAGAAHAPWGRLGPGWVLAQYSSAHPEGGGHGPVTLYLISPGGTKYRVASWPDSNSAPQLVAWSPDGSRALFQVFTPHPGVEQLTLATGAFSLFSLPGDATPIGYTTPTGRNIVASQVAGTIQSLARYSLSGRLLHKLGLSADGQVLYSPGGTRFVTGDQRGVRLVSNNGALIRELGVPHTAQYTCNPARWWNSSTILVNCAPPNTAASQLWLVPASGARPKALTPPRPPNSQDLGDLDAWQLGTGLYLQAAGPCGVLHIFRQTASGIQMVTVPHTTGNDNHVLTAMGSRLLVQAETSCTGSNSLLWFNPATHAEQWLVRAPGNVIGVSLAIPFYNRENAVP